MAQNPDANFNSQREEAAAPILQQLLVRGPLSRNQLRECTGFSPASITNYTRALLSRGLLLSEPVAVAGSKRPVSFLRIAPDCGSAILLRTESNSLTAELLALNGEVRAERIVAYEARNQSGVLGAIGHAVAALFKRARDEQLEPLLAGLGAAGSVAPEYGIVFDLQGVTDWEPCQPGEILPVLREIPSFMVWTQVSCKVAGLAVSRKNDHRLAYLDFSGNTLRLASLQNGRILLGRYGTVSALLHRTVARNGSPCYCGRRGCLVPIIENGRATEKIIVNLVRRLATELDVSVMGIEGPEATERLERQVAGRCLDALVRVSEGAAYTARGLRYLAAKAALLRLLAGKTQPQAD